MTRTIPDLYRQQSIEDLFKTDTMKSCWPVWKPEIQRLLGSSYSAGQVLNLGDHLSDIFKSTGGAGRGQGELSAGGTAWESLVCWYINLCTVGSRIVAVKKMSLVPQAIRDALTVNYGNLGCEAESDITILVFPDQFDYNNDVGAIAPTPLTSSGHLSLEVLDALASKDFAQFEVSIVRCTTGWDDNVQIPMLWDMIYSTGRFGVNGTTGKNGFSIKDCTRFTYSFVTVPTNDTADFSETSQLVRRSTTLSGGNYWGRQTEECVSSSLKEIFGRNFQSGFRNSLWEDLTASLRELRSKSDYDYFGL